MIGIICITLVLAGCCALVDGLKAKDHKPIIHTGIIWCMRAFALILLCLISRLGKYPIQWLDLAISLVAMAPLFSLVFRITMNAIRDLRWNYVSPSNWYDRLWIKWSKPGMFMGDVKKVLLFHKELYYADKDSLALWDRFRIGSEDYRKWVHRAGTHLSLFEAILFTGIMLVLHFTR